MRSQNAGQGGEQRCLTGTARADQDDELPIHHIEMEPLERPYRSRPGVVVDGEVANDKLAHHHAPAKARAGSTVTARRNAIPLATTPMATASAGNRR
jgi:hypothetical protein